MKNLFTIIVALFCIHCAYSQWFPQNVPINDQLLSVHFTDSQNGYVTGFSGALLKTNNGGLNWDVTFPSTVAIYTIFFPTNDTGYMAGDAGRILKTIDGGINWVTLTNTPHYKYSSIYFTNAQTGYVVGIHKESIILKTINGGDTWDTCLIFPNFIFTDIIFPEPQTGYVTGHGFGTTPYGAILKTTDGGINWSDTIIAIGNHPASSICMLSADTGYVASWGELWRTNDGWESWTMQISPLENNSPIFFTSYEIGYGVGSSGFNMIIYKTSDGGMVWEEQYRYLYGYIYELFFSAQDTGFAVGYNWDTYAGLIIQTENGGIPVHIDESYHISNVLEIFPNPAKSTIYIDLSEPISENTILEIYNYSGDIFLKQQLTKSKTELNITHLPAGVYIVKVWNDKNVMVQKVFKQ